MKIKSEVIVPQSQDCMTGQRKEAIMALRRIFAVKVGNSKNIRKKIFKQHSYREKKKPPQNHSGSIDYTDFKKKLPLIFTTI